LVAYGSQTGNAESISQEFHENLELMGFNAKHMALNKTKKINFPDEVGALLIGNCWLSCMANVLILVMI
jgi:flavodoxin